MNALVEMPEPVVDEPMPPQPERTDDGSRQEALRASELRFRTLIEHLPQRVFFKDRNSVFVCVNAAFAGDFGLSPDALVGKSDLDFFPPEMARKFQADDQRVMNLGRPETIEETNTVAGESRIVEVVKIPVTNDRGEVVGLLGMFRDVTHLKRTEEQLQRSRAFLHSVIENLPITVFIKDAADLRFVLWNKAGEELTGCPRETFLGKTDYDFFLKDDADGFTASDREVLRSGKLLDVPEEIIHTRSRGTRILHTRKIPILDDQGNARFLVGISEDVTERKAAEERLRELAARLEQNNRELQDFAYVASHDLQEPLRKVNAFGDRLRAKCGATLGEQGLDYLDRMQNAAQRMQVLINDLLAYSRVTTHAKPFAPTDLAAVLKGVLSDLEVRIEQSAAKVSVGELPVIDADPTQMRQLFQNLIGNALKFHRQNVPPVVKVSGQILAPNAPPAPHGAELPSGLAARRLCQIRVEDNGIGFDEKYLDRIFTVFQRLHGRGEYEGSGVGLAICRKIVLRHGGHITAHSQPGLGAIFVIHLPCQQANGENQR
jgi:two-component system, LuxR family, sensor kinase FixL